MTEKHTSCKSAQYLASTRFVRLDSQLSNTSKWNEIQLSGTPKSSKIWFLGVPKYVFFYFLKKMSVTKFVGQRYFILEFLPVSRIKNQ